jgi:hypothetical protein
MAVLVVGRKSYPVKFRMKFLLMTVSINVGHPNDGRFMVRNPTCASWGCLISPLSFFQWPPMLSRCVRVFEISIVDRSETVALAAAGTGGVGRSADSKCKDATQGHSELLEYQF